MKENRSLTLTLLAAIVMTLPASAHAQVGNTLDMLFIGLGYTAKETCTCLFVMGRSAADCRAETAIEQITPRVRVDWNEKIVIADYYRIFWRSAKWTGEKTGCVLEN